MTEGITNTSTQSPLDHLGGSLVMGPSEYIEHTEKEGQRQLVSSQLLPAQARGLTSEWGWNELEALGFRKGEPVDGDPLFVHAEMPEGWTKQAADGAFWSYLVDERGVKRAAIFYKAAFYDRKASMTLTKPGYELVTEVIYGEGPVELPELWSVLTDDERKQGAEAIALYEENGRTHPDIYREQAERAGQLGELITAWWVAQ